MANFILKCDHCHADLVERTTRNGRKILACPNWRADGRGCSGTIYDPNREGEHKTIYPRVLIRLNVPSRSEPGKNRTVEVYEDGNMRCNCMAGEMQKFCHHKKVIVKTFEDLLKKIKEVNKLNG